MADEERLLVQEDQHHVGRKIAFYQRCLVEMPDEAIIGQEARVNLEVARTSQSGKNVYRALPAPPIPSERWQDLGDGTAARQAMETDWLGVTREVGSPEIRQLATREGTPSVRRDRLVVWGSDLASTQVKTVEVKVIPIETEKIVNANLAWSKVGEREEPQPPVLESVTKIDIPSIKSPSGDSARFNAVYSPDWMLLVRVDYRNTQIDVHPNWVDLPQFLQAEIEGRYPVCFCGRKRYDRQNPDGYSKCEECRKEENCVRCGKQSKVTNQNGRLVCEPCQAYEEPEQWIHDEIGETGIAKIVAEVEKLLAGQALTQELGEKLLAATLEETDEFLRRDAMQKLGGFKYYYFCNDGVFGSKLAPTALIVLSHLSEAAGNAKVELFAWIAQDCGRPPRNIPDFYLETQVKGEKFEVSQFDGRTEKDLCQYVQELADRIQSGEPFLAQWIRESETARLAKLEHRQVLAAHLTEQYSRCPLCGGSVSIQNNLGRCDCLGSGKPDGFEWEYDDDGNESLQLLKQTMVGETEIVWIQAVPHRRGDYVSFSVADDLPALSKQTKLEVKEYPWFVDEAERQRRERVARERRWYEDYQNAKAQVADSDLVKLSFRRGWNKKTREEQWEAGGRDRKYIIDRYCHREPLPGLVYFCRLGNCLVKTKEFELWTVHIVPPYPEEAPEEWSDEVDEAEEEVPDASEEVEPDARKDEGEITDEAKAALLARFGRK